MPGKRPRSFLRTSSRPQLLQSYGDESLSPLPRAAVKCAMGTPQRVVVGFDVRGGDAAENSSKAHADACESPRSVLEPDALGDDHHHHHHPRPPSASPRSVLDRLLSRPETPSPGSNEGICVRILADIRPEKPAVRETGLTIPEGGNPNIAIPEQICVVDYPQRDAVKEELTSMLPSCHVNTPEDVVFGGDDEDDDNVSSIFYAASPFSCCGSLEAPAGDFLSGCFFCKSCLMPGKDIYMYRGDRAFCSAECRYQQIIVDERKERRSAASNCYAKHFPHMREVPSGLS